MQSRLDQLEAEMVKKNEAIFTLGDMLKAEKIRSAELNENYKAVEAVYKQSFGAAPQIPFPNQAIAIDSSIQRVLPSNQ